MTQLGSKQQKAPLKSESTAERISSKLISSVTEIRHAAVHRHRLSARDVEKFLQDSKHLLVFFGDVERLERVTTLRRKTHDLLTQLDRDEKKAQTALETKKKEIDAQRKALQKLEEAAVLEVDQIREDFRNTAASNIIREVGRTETCEDIFEQGQISGVSLPGMIWMVCNVLGWSIRLLVCGVISVFVFVSRHVV